MDFACTILLVCGIALPVLTAPQKPPKVPETSFVDPPPPPPPAARPPQAAQVPSPPPPLPVVQPGMPPRRVPPSTVGYVSNIVQQTQESSPTGDFSYRYFMLLDSNLPVCSATFLETGSVKAPSLVVVLLSAKCALHRQMYFLLAVVVLCEVPIEVVGNPKGRQAEVFLSVDFDEDTNPRDGGVPGSSYIDKFEEVTVMENTTNITTTTKPSVDKGVKVSGQNGVSIVYPASRLNRVKENGSQKTKPTPKPKVNEEKNSLNKTTSFQSKLPELRLKPKAVSTKGPTNQNS